MIHRFAPGFALLLLCAGCGREEPARAASEATPPTVRVAALRAEPQSFSSSVSITGTLISPATVTVKAETTGRVLRIAKVEGDPVSQGEPVVWVDDSHEKLSVLQADSAVQVTQAALDRARVVQSHTASEWVRAQHLLASGGITDRDYKSAELADKDAKAQIALADAQLAQARAQLEFTRKMLADSIVRSPITGEIQTKLTAEGAYVEPPTPVFSVVNNAVLELESMVASALLSTIRPKQQVRFSVNTFPGQQFTGEVIEINPGIYADTRSAKVRVRVDNARRRLKTGMFVQGEILSEVRRQGILLPASAVYRNDRSLASGFVYVIAEGRARKREVSLGIEHESSLEIPKGLAPGELVALEQSIELADGVSVAPEIRSR